MMEESGQSPKKRLRLQNQDEKSAHGQAQRGAHSDGPPLNDEDTSVSASECDTRAPWNHWSVEEVAQKLSEMGVPDDAVKKFRDNKIDGRVLINITEDHIRDTLNIPELGSQLKIQQFLKDVKSGVFSTLKLKGSKVFNDPVHGHMELHPLCVAIIDTPQFQRLRYLKQLGVGYFVYPGASHNRFEHSLGVCFLAGLLVKTLKEKQPELSITDEDILCVQIAGLCHDLGHGPFSHTFDNIFIPCVKPDSKWKHEKASIEMFDHLVKVNKLEPKFKDYGITEAHRVFIKEQISCEALTKTASGEMTWYYKRKTDDRSQSVCKAFLYEIVSNDRNGVDVDKWDYFKRDCHHLGINSSFDHMRVIQFSRVICEGDQWQICFRDKEAFNMYEMFHTRFALHRRAYQHKVVQAVEIMLVEALQEAEECITIPGDDGKTCKISECISSMPAFTNLTDSIFHLILLDTRRDNPHLKRAQEILQNIQRRKLYKCVGETEPIKDGDITEKSVKQIKEEILAELQEQNGVDKSLELDTSSFVVQKAKLDFGKKEKNPVNDIRFFSKGEPNKAKAFRSEEVSYMLPQELFKEQLVRVFLRPTETEVDDRKRLELLYRGFESWCHKNNQKNPKVMTPFKGNDPSRPTRPIKGRDARRSVTFV